MVESTLTINSELHEVARAREWIAAMAQESGLSREENYQLQLVVTEACTNSIKHAYGMEKGHSVDLEAQIDDTQIRLLVRDFGKKLEPQNHREPDLENPAEAGFGIYLLRSIMNEVRIDLSRDEGTEVTMVKYRSKFEDS